MNIEELGRHYAIIDFSNIFTQNITNIYYKEGEVGTSSIRAKLMTRKKSINLTGCKVIVNILNDLGETIIDFAEIVNAEEGIVDIRFENVALVKGVSFFELTILKDEKTKKSPRIAYKVIDSIDDEGLMESENYPILLKLIKDTEDLNAITNDLSDKTTQLNQDVMDLNERMNEAESVRNSQEDTRQSQEEVRQAQEENRQEQEISRVENMERFNQEFIEFKNNTNSSINEFKSTVDESINNFNETINTFKNETNEVLSGLPRIDNDVPSNVNTYSSNKIIEELSKKSEFDGSYNSLTDTPEQYVHPQDHNATMIMHSDGEDLETKINNLLLVIEELKTRIDALETV